MVTGPVEVEVGAKVEGPISLGADAGADSAGVPAVIVEVTSDIVANPGRYGAIVSHRFPFSAALEALRVAMTPGAAEKVVVTMD